MEQRSFTMGCTSLGFLLISTAGVPEGAQAGVKYNTMGKKTVLPWFCGSLSSCLYWVCYYHVLSPVQSVWRESYNPRHAEPVLGSLIFLPWVSFVASSKGITIWNPCHQTCWASDSSYLMLLTAYSLWRSAPQVITLKLWPSPLL